MEATNQKASAASFDSVSGIQQTDGGTVMAYVIVNWRKGVSRAERNCTTWVVPDGPGLAGGVGPLALTPWPAWASSWY